MHTHFGVLVIGASFIGVLLAGTVWRISAAHLASSSNPTARNVGSAMAFQY